MTRTYYTNVTETWDAKRCAKEARHVERDGMGTRYPWPGYIGRRFGKVTYNGGCVHDDVWYNGEVFPLPDVAEGFSVVEVSTWGYRIVKGDK